MHLEEKLEEVLGRKFNISKKDRLLVAVSGGKDSICLFHLLTSLGYSIAVAHCNFGLRDKASDEDALFVQQLCEKQGVPFHQKRFDTSAFATAQKMGIQEAARELRYGWFNELLIAHSYNYVVTAHHGDDVAETILMNIARGTGIRGLRGIPQKNGSVIRPLLFAKKTEIDNYITTNGISFREDSSNETDHYTRNYIRHHIVPPFEQINDQFINHMVQLSLLSNEAQSIIDQAIHEFRKIHTKQEGSYTYINIDGLLQSPAPSYYLYEIASVYGFNIHQVKSIFDSLHSQSGNHFLSEFFQLIKDRSELIISPVSDEKVCIKIDQFPFEVHTNHYHIHITQPGMSAPPPSFEEGTFYIDMARVSADELIIRNWLPGDRFTPLGMMNGSKKISDYLIDKKVPLSHKKDALVLATNDDIIALLPYQISEHFKLNHEAKNMLKIIVNKGI